ncbi:MAG: hypothetical protein ABI210_11320 [Abditibacteriaceae bacterium]
MTTLTINPTSRNTAFLKREAKKRGVAVEQLASQLFIEAVEDMEDAVEAESILSKTDSRQWRTLDDLRQAVRG